MKKILTLIIITLAINATAQNVGIGTTTPSRPLTIKADGIGVSQESSTGGAKIGFYTSGTNAYLQTHNAVDLKFATNDSTFSMILKRGSGNLGIGQANPTVKLDVNGNFKADTIMPTAIKITPNAGEGKILTSDAAGNASWQSKGLNGSVGYGTWGDCSTNSISEYNPVVDHNAEENDYLGRAVSVSGNFAIVGVPYDDVGANSEQGSVIFYEFNGTNWVFKQKLNEALGAANDNYGFRVSISGNYAFVGIASDDIGANTNQGSVNVFFYNGSNWVFTQKLTDTNGQAGDAFGSDVSVNGSVAVIGANGDDNTLLNVGSVSFYQLLAGSWIFKQKVFDNIQETDNYFGTSVSISGNYAIVGIPNDDISVNIDQGSASIFFNNGSNWVFTQKINGLSGGARCGSAVSISNTNLVVGSPNVSVGAFDRGAVAFYRYNGSIWILVKEIISPINSTQFGTSVCIDGDYAIVGDVEDGQSPGNEQGTATIYQRVGMGWQKLQKFETPDNDRYYRTGQAVSIDGTTKRFVVGVPGYGNYSGKAIFGKVN
jgi:hypothetical protein